MIKIKKAELMEIGNNMILLKEVNEEQVKAIIYKELMKRSILAEIE